MVSLYGIKVIGWHSIFLCEYTCLMTLVTELLFGTSFLLPPAPPPPPSPSLLSSLVLLLLWYFSLLHPRSNLACEIAPFSSAPRWSAPLRFPVWVAAITLALSLVRDLGRRKPPPIHRHGDDPTSITMETTFAQRRATPILRTQTSHLCLYTHKHLNTHCINIWEDTIACFDCFVFLWAAVSVWEVWKSGESKFMEFK